MSIDYSALLGLSQGIQVVKADYSFTRDGGPVGIRGIATEVMPTGSILLALLSFTTIGFTFAAGGVATFRLGGLGIFTPAYTLNEIAGLWLASGAAIVTTKDSAVDMAITVNNVTAGAATLWLFYLPT